MTFSNRDGIDLALKSLEKQGKTADQQIQIDNVIDDGPLQRATVFVPNGQVGHFLRRFEEYARKNTDTGKPRNQKLVESIGAVQLATLEAMWTDALGAHPAPEEEAWFEVWLRHRDGNEVGRLRQYAAQLNFRVGPRMLRFDDRVVVLVRGTLAQLAGSIAVLDDLVELRRAPQCAAPFFDMGNEEQAEWVEELLTRVSSGAPRAYVCVLDTGVNGGHPLLEPFLAAGDAHVVDPAWGTQDHDGHGTEMAGLALLGNLAPLLLSKDPVWVPHRIESVKILPPPGQPANDPELYGAIVAEAVSRVEITDVARRRAFSISVASTDQRDLGKPTSWSTAIDALAVGRSFDSGDSGLRYLDSTESEQHRLFVLSAGNVDEPAPDHLTASDNEAVHDPGQAWNAITVGAYTELTELDPNDPTLKGYKPVAPVGELSPFSATSVPFGRQWPIKPDIVMEGGNVATTGTPGHPCLTVDSLSVLTTGAAPDRLLVPSWATSPAAAQAARIAANIWAQYPAFWPETVRALLVHSAEWTPRMRQRIKRAKNKSEVESLVRRYGFGVPSLERALWSAGNALTLVVQDSIRPFADGRMREMHLHELPWPTGALKDLFDAEVRLRVTLSYFIEPTPGRRGWKTRHRYASHSLRFDLCRPGEPVDVFRKRVNAAARQADEKRPAPPDDTGWLLGGRRNRGSLHADIWEGTAIDLADRNHLVIYPVTGWWKDQKTRDRSRFGARYSLIVSIETDREDVDIWTPVAVALGIPVTT